MFVCFAGVLGAWLASLDWPANHKAAFQTKQRVACLVCTSFVQGVVTAIQRKRNCNGVTGSDRDDQSVSGRGDQLVRFASVTFKLCNADHNTLSASRRGIRCSYWPGFVFSVFSPSDSADFGQILFPATVRDPSDPSVWCCT